jgi:hypothetical protein
LILYPFAGNRVWFQRPDGVLDSFMQTEGLAQGCPLSVVFSYWFFGNSSDNYGQHW